MTQDELTAVRALNRCKWTRCQPFVQGLVRLAEKAPGRPLTRRQQLWLWRAVIRYRRNLSAPESVRMALKFLGVG